MRDADTGTTSDSTGADAIERPSPGPVFELREYTLHLGQRDVLIELFDRELVETQEACGMTVVGQFRDLDRPNRFIWLRSFPDMSSRAKALGAFYGGLAWAAHRDAANATMTDSDNVLLLRPAVSDQAPLPPAGARPAPGTGGDGPGLVVATILHLQPSGSPDEFARLFDATARPGIEASGAMILGRFLTEESPNTFPRLPVREGERVHVTLARYPDATASEAARAAHKGDQAWSENVAPLLRQHLKREPEVLRLKPTARSLLHG